MDITSLNKESKYTSFVFQKLVEERLALFEEDVALLAKNQEVMEEMPLDIIFDNFVGQVTRVYQT